MFCLTIELPHDKKTVEVPEQQRPRLLTDVLRQAGIPLNTRCGHRALCDGCLVELRAGKLQKLSGGAVVEPHSTLVRGCQICLPVTGAATVHVPARSLLAHQPQVVASFRLNVPRAHDPLWQKIHVPQEQLVESQPLHESLLAAVSAELDCGLPIQWDDSGDVLSPAKDGSFELVLEHLGDHRTLRGCELHEPAFGLAVDIGTTTVVVTLVELTTGRVVANASGLNAQTKMGDNVLTRINLCMTQPRLIQRMQQSVVRSTLAPLISDALRQAEIAPHQLTCMVVAGNTTMLHLLLGVDPTSLGMAPFTPTFLQHTVVSASQLALRVTPPGKALSHVAEDAPEEEGPEEEGPEEEGPEDDLPEDDLPEEGTDAGEGAKSQRVIPHMAVHLLPGAAAYVGADITAGVLASGMAYRNDTCLLVDLGTNGEIVLRHKQALIGCATAAGPAFEGAGLTFGMRAGDGAVGHIWLDEAGGKPRIEVIGKTSPIGICGTAYIDFVARARQQGLLSPTARFAVAEHPYVIRHEKHGRALVVAQQEDAEPLLITEADMASLLQAKAAIAAGIICLLREAELQPEDVQTVYLAGGFGFHMHIDSLLGCGMLPGFRQEQVEAVGNTALAGAYLTLLDSGALREIRRVSSEMKIVELNLAPDFEMIYIDQLSLL